MLIALTDNITSLEKALPLKPNDVKHQSTQPPSTIPDDISPFVEHVELDDLAIDDDLADAISNELKSMKLVSPIPTKIKTQWLSPSSESYNYGSVINNPKPICDYPNICKLMDIVNKHPSSTGDMDACIVSCFPTSQASLNLHKDAEDLMCQSSSICTVSFGAPRTLEFVRDGKMTGKKGKKYKDLRADISCPATDRTMNVMKPGGQYVMKHRVPRGKHVEGSSSLRYSISFRKIVQKAELDEEKKEEESPTQKADKSTKPSTSKKSIVLVAGDSFPGRLDADRLGRGKKTVVNIAKGGSSIVQVEKAIKDFVDDNPSYQVTKLFVSIGTNDSRYCKDGCRHLKEAVCKFMKFVKNLLPNTKIYFQSLLPILNGSPYTVRNVYEMNEMIYYLCSRYKLFYIDVFSSFLNPYGYRNDSLFPKYDSEKQFHDIHHLI